jgi:N-acyl-D-aspartate/D-glutamate deacylase
VSETETETEPLFGYHKAAIARGVFGEDSKIYEEIDEFADALDQNVQIMALVELSDVIGAIEGWLVKHHPTVTLADLAAMAAVTRRAFESGGRENRDG